MIFNLIDLLFFFIDYLEMYHCYFVLRGLPNQTFVERIILLTVYKQYPKTRILAKTQLIECQSLLGCRLLQCLVELLKLCLLVVVDFFLLVMKFIGV